MHLGCGCQERKKQTNTKNVAGAEWKLSDGKIGGRKPGGEGSGKKKNRVAGVGTHRVAGTEAMTHPHVYLFDARLGMIWQVTREHIAGSPEYEYDLGAHNCVSPVGVAKSGSRRRNTLAAEDCADDPWKCCHVNSGTDVKGNQNAMISGDGNSIVWTSDFDNTFSNLTVGEDGGTVSWLTEVYHYHIPTSRRALSLAVTTQGSRYCSNSFRLLAG